MTCDPSIVCLFRFIGQTASAVDLLTLLIRSGPASAQEAAIKALYTLGVQEDVKRTVVRKGLIEHLCGIAMHGEATVQAHAAWLVGSMLVRGEKKAKEFLYDRKTMSQLAMLVTSANPKVVVQAAWALSNLPASGVSFLDSHARRYDPLVFSRSRETSKL